MANGSNEGKIGQNPVVDWAFKFLGSLALPLFLWGISLQMDVHNLQKDMEQNKEETAQLEKLENSVRSNALALERFKEKFNNVEEKVSDIRKAVSK